MRTRVPLITGAIALAICIVCPFVDMFDQWDRAFQTGHDTEYPLVVLALCIGAAMVLGRLILTFSLNLSVSSIRFAIISSLNSFTYLIRPAEMVPAFGSPPVSLRI